jgi:hypothetical protein
MGDHVYLKVKARKSSLKLGNCAKMTPRFCGPFEILARMGPIAYQLALPANLRIHNVFHVSLLKKYIHDPTHMNDWNFVQVEPEGEFQVEPLHILDRREVVLRKRVITRVRCNGSTLLLRRPLGSWREICGNRIQFCSKKGTNTKDSVLLIHLWQFRISNLIIVINYYDCWAEI